MKKKLLLGGVLLVAAMLLVFFITGSGNEFEERIIVPVKKGHFEVSITSTGELQARNSEKILGPDGLRQAGIWRVKISDIVPEGTVVKKGDFIATLDRTEVSTKLKDLSTEVDKNQSLYIQTKLDTTLELRKTRDELVNLKFAMEERDIEVKQSKFEPPAIQRQAEINLEKARRAYEQALKNYRIKKSQSVAKMQEVGATLSQVRNKYIFLQDLLREFEITAPKSGMLIYERDWDGKRKSVGSAISPWDPVVAQLPDLSQMISRLYINEVDISKIEKGQKVILGVDAFPEKKFSGQVYQVANVGEDLPNVDAKVFEVLIRVNESDTMLRPGMTTSNTIITRVAEDVIFIPLESIHSNDTMSYVFKDEGSRTVRQEVIIGLTNENEAVVKKGLEVDDEVYLTIPENPNDLRLVLLKENDI